MNRRKILQLTGASFATGVGANYVSARQEDGQENGDEQDDEEGTACEPDVRFGDRELLVDDTGFSDDLWAVVAVENAGDLATGEIAVTVEWLDADGNFIDDDDQWLPSLDGGETWLAHVSALGPDSEDVENFEVTGEFETDYPRPPNGMRVTETELVDGDVRPEIAGTAENTREEDLEYVAAQGKFYDEDGTVLAGNSTLERDLPAETDWSFTLGMQSMPYQAAEPTDHDVTLDGRTFQIQG